MRPIRPFLLLTATLLTTSALAAQARRTEYEISFPNAAQHEARVTATFVGIPVGTPLHVRMSRASPGRYALTQFAKNVYDVSATDGRGRVLAVTRPDPHGWAVGGHNGTVRLSYTVWGDRADGTYLQIDASHAHLNMPATFAWARGFDAAPVRLTVRPRDGWRVVTQLTPTLDSVSFTAPNVAYFMDSPTEVGPVTVRTWQTTHGGRPSTWRLAVHHLGTDAQVDSFATMAQRIVAEQVASWGEPPGLDYGVYTFIADYLPWANGDAMEHRNSTFLTGRTPIAERAGRVTQLGSLSHELFHAWNGERLRARSLEPFDFERENMSAELWFAEGFTSYFDDLFIRRAGYYTDEEYLRQLADNVIGTIDSPARAHGSAVDMSRLAPFFDGGSYLDPVNRQNTFLSYYTWGAALGLALDLTLRGEHDATLEDFMRAMWRDFGRHQSRALAPMRTYTLRDLRVTLGRVARDTAFANGFFRRYIEGRDVPDYAALLARAGFRLAADSIPRPFLGASFADDPNAVFVNWSIENGSLYHAGIVNGDVIHAIDGEATSSIKALDSLMTRRNVGDVVRVDVTQRGQRKTLPMTLRGLPRLRLVTYESAGLPMTDAMRAFRQAWLGSKADSGASR
jgi:predicted metalloprotease with PDZ domain